MTIEKKLEEMFRRADSKLPRTGLDYTATLARARRGQRIRLAAAFATAALLVAAGGVSARALLSGAPGSGPHHISVAQGPQERPSEPDRGSASPATPAPVNSEPATPGGTTSPTPGQEPTPTTSPGGPGPVAAASCSAAGMDAALTPQPALPSEVQSVRDQIFNLALACDFEGLSDLARAPSGSFTYSFGGSNGDLAGYLKDADNHENALRVLVGLLDTPYVTPQDVYGPEYSGPQGYWWPSAFRSSPTDADWEALEGVIPAAELQTYRSSGSYVGWRLFITKDGDWQIFVTGD